MITDLRIPILLGTVRQGRRSENVAKLIVQEVSKHKSIKTELIDIREIGLTAEDEGTNASLPEFAQKMAEMDGLIIVSPEYNHSYPGSLKMALDRNLPEYQNKAVGLVGVSNGNWGGVRMVEKLTELVVRLGMKPIKTSSSLYYPNVGKIFDEHGNLIDESYRERIFKFLNELIWLTKALKWGRENLDDYS